METFTANDVIVAYPMQDSHLRVFQQTPKRGYKTI
jgi:hypothetical protein